MEKRTKKILAISIVSVVLVFLGFVIWIMIVLENAFYSTASGIFEFVRPLVQDQPIENPFKND